MKLFQNSFSLKFFSFLVCSEFFFFFYFKQTFFFLFSICHILFLRKHILIFIDSFENNVSIHKFMQIWKDRHIFLHEYILCKCWINTIDINNIYKHTYKHVSSYAISQKINTFFTIWIQIYTFAYERCVFLFPDILYSRSAAMKSPKPT